MAIQGIQAKSSAMAQRAASLPDDDRAAAPRSGRLWWIGPYRVMLFAILLAYYGFLIYGLFFLCQLAWSVGPALATLTAGGLFAWVVLVVDLALIVQLVRLIFWQSIPGLVTPIYDTVPEAAAGIALSPGQHPEVYRVVTEVAELVGAPLPDQVRVTQQAECYVTEQRRFSWKTKRRLTLVLGLPHLAVLRVAELKVILAHELAHVRSGDTRLGVFLFRFIELLNVAATQLGHGRFKWVNPLYWFCIGYSHMFLRLSAPVLRQEEIRADCVSAKTFGGELAARTLLKDWLLSGQFDAAVDAYAAQMTGGGQDPSLTVYHWFIERWREFSPAGHEYLQRRLAELERTTFFDSHPTIQERIEAMRAFPSSEPPETPLAHNLVHDYKGLELRLHHTLFPEVPGHTATAH